MLFSTNWIGNYLNVDTSLYAMPMTVTYTSKANELANELWRVLEDSLKRNYV
jgi:hypothetical protein